MDNDADKHLPDAMATEHPSEDRIVDLLRLARHGKCFVFLISYGQYLYVISLTVVHFFYIGSNLTMFTFPVLFLACLSCVYLHLGAKNEAMSEKKANNGIKLWKRPLLVKGPLGIVSGTELAFLVMFVMLLVWSLSMYLHNSFAKITPQVAGEEGETV